MRLLTYDDGSGAHAGIQVEHRVVAAASLGAPADSVKGLLQALDAAGLAALGERANKATESMPLADLRLLPPIPDPEKVICLGLNYRDHAEETGQEIPTAPMWFAKFASSLIGSGGEIVMPAAHAEYVDYEAELALVIGRRAKNVGAEDALSHIAGAMAFNPPPDAALAAGDILIAIGHKDQLEQLASLANPLEV